MTGSALAALIALGGLFVYGELASRKRLRALADPSSAISRTARITLSSLDAKQLASIRQEISRGRTLNAIKQVREEVPGLGLREAEDAIELLKRNGT